MTRGCDISSVQGTVDFDALKPAVSFVIAKATEGVGFPDAAFARNWAETGRVGLGRGAYHFARPDLGNTAQDEARWFLSQLGPLDGTDRLALDYEVDWKGDVVGWCHQWLHLVRSVTGITPDLYLNLYLSHVYDWSSVIADGFPLWLADYDGLPDTPIQTPWPRVAIKQYTSTGALPGIVGNVDLNSMEEDMTPQQIYDAIAPLLQEKIVAPQHDTNTWLKEYIDAVKAGDAAAIATAETKIGVALGRGAQALADSATLVQADAAAPK